ncbi:transposase, partial [Xanthomonas translucens]
MAHRKEISTALWKRIHPLIPVVPPSPKGGRPRVDDQSALNGIVYVLRTGIAWEDLP